MGLGGFPVATLLFFDVFGPSEDSRRDLEGMFFHIFQCFFPRNLGQIQVSDEIFGAILAKRPSKGISGS